MAKAASHTGKMDFSNITLHVYPGAEGRFMLYEDAEEGYAYEKGEYRLTEARVTADGDVTTAVLHQGYDAPVEYTVCNHRKDKGGHLALCALTTLTPTALVSIDGDLSYGGVSHVCITAENLSDALCTMRYTVSAVRMDSGREFGFSIRLADQNGKTLTGIYH